MGDMGGMGGLGGLFNDPEMMAAFADPEVAAAFKDISANPANIMKYQNNPKVRYILTTCGEPCIKMKTGPKKK